MLRFSRLVLLSTFALLASAISLQAQTLKPKRVTIYKAGLAHIIKEGDLLFKDHVALLETNVSPLLGTYWLNGEKGTSMQFGVDTVKVSRDVYDFFGLLEANPGKTVHLTYSYVKQPDKLHEAAGEIVKYYSGSRMLKLKTASGSSEFYNLNQAEILNLSLNGQETNTYTADSIYRVQKVFSQSDEKRQQAQLHYVGTGFTWIPSYYVRVLNDKQVRVEMKALVENFAEPLEGVETDLVIGTPTLAFGMQTDPLMSGNFDQAFDNIIANNQGGFSIRGGRASSNAIRLANGLVTDGADESRAYFQDDYSTEGQKSFDLYHYKLGPITLPVNTKAYYPIFAEKLPYEEVYTANIGDQVAFEANLVVNKTESSVDVNHSLKIKNNTNYPITTASVVVEDENSQFLSQDRVVYTPIKGDIMVNLSRAIDVTVKNSEQETNREVKYRKIGEYQYSRAQITGTITLHNYQKKAITVAVTKNVKGEVKAVPGGKSQQINAAGVNPDSVMKWDVALEPGETKKVTYEYETLFYPR